MLKNFKIKVFIVLIAAVLMGSAVLMFYQPRDREEGARLAQDLWGEVQSPELKAQKNTAYSKDFPVGFKDASMGKAMTGPIKVEGG